MADMVYRMTVLDRIKHFCIRKVLKRSAFGRLAYPALQKLYRLYSVPMKHRRLQRNGVDCMRRLHELMTVNGIEYYCDSGTLLGFIRDHRFIKNDDDIDISIVEGSIDPIKLLKLFLDAGYGYVHAFDYNGKILEFTVADVSQITIDVYFQTLQKGSDSILDAWGVYWKPDVDYPSETANSVISYPFLKPDGFKSIDVLGIQVRVPANAEEVLDTEYHTWRTPDPNFKHDQEYPHTDWPGFCFRLSREEALARI